MAAAARDVAGRDWLATSRDAAVDSDEERKQKEVTDQQIYCVLKGASVQWYHLSCLTSSNLSRI
jgi:hypothetical protein